MPHFTPISNEYVVPSVHAEQSLLTGFGECRQPMPIAFPVVRERFLDSRFNFWVPNEIPMIEDKQQFQNGLLTDDEFRLLRNNISYLSVGDNLVPDNIVTSLLPRIKSHDMRQYLRWVIAEEANHVESYLFILESLGIDEKGQGDIFQLYANTPILAKKVNWNIKFSNMLRTDLPSNDPVFVQSLLENLIAYYLFEYVFFPAGFSQIFALARNGKLRNTAQQYSFIWRDETQHAANASFMINHLLFNEFKSEVTLRSASFQNRLRYIVDEGITLEMEHAEHVIGNGINGYSLHDYRAYVEFLTNLMCDSIGVKRIFDTPTNRCPIEWIHTYQITTEANFFESRVTDYKTGNSLIFK